MSESYSSDEYSSGLYSAADTPSSVELSSWSFSIDGHPLVVVCLGKSGTFIFDSNTGKWAEWYQRGMVGIGLSGGRVFGEFCVMGSKETGDIYAFDPDSLSDDGDSFETVVTGGLPAKGRESSLCSSVYAEANRSDDNSREVKLYTSDDGGHTWDYQGSVFPTGTIDEISWRSLGIIRAPGRLFRVVDNGALLSIDALVMGSANA